MHYCILVVLEEKPDRLEAAVHAELEASEEEHWDWYQIGGRSTGLLSGSDPMKDPLNIETCESCQGTGRDDIQAHNICTLCHGTGVVLTCLKLWRQHDGDVVPHSSITDEKYKFHEVVYDRTFYFRWRYEPSQGDFGYRVVEQPLPQLSLLKEQYPNGVGVVVDIHN